MSTARTLRLLGALLALAPGPLLAAYPASEAVEVALQVHRLATDLDVEGSRIETRSTRVGVQLFETSSTWLQPGLQLGYLQLTQSANPSTSGMALTGEFLGVLLRSQWALSERAALQLLGGYAYHDADNARSGQDTRLNWHELQLRLGATLQLARTALSAGGSLQLIDGDETASGDVTATRDFEQHASSGGYLGIDYRVDAGGSIGLLVEGGARRGASLIFSRAF